MPSINDLRAETRALILHHVPMTTAEQVIHARAALEEARQGLESLANLYYAERRLACARISSRYDIKPAQRDAVSRALAALEADIDELRGELSSLEVAS